LQVSNTFTGAYIIDGATDEGLRAHLAPWQDVRVLELKNLVPGTFGGFTEPGKAAQIDDRVFGMLTDRKWCCSGEQPMPVAQLEWPYALPMRLRERIQAPGTLVAPYHPYPVPHYEQPQFCEDIKQDVHNAKFLSFDNHPCTFLGMNIVLPSSVQEILA
jgi:hypothetical protein